MPTPIPLTFRAAPLPINFVGTPQDLVDALIDRLSAESSNDISFFAAGPVAPTSDVGPWLKNFVTWYVWSTALATYIPEIIEFESLKYIASQTAPDQTKYVFWIKLDGTGKAVGIFYYSGGAWKDVYEDVFAAFDANHPTNAQMATAIAAAVGSQERHAFRGYKLSTQTVTGGSGDQLVEFGGETYDTGSDYDPSTSKFTAPVNGIYEFKVSCLVVRNTGSNTSMQVGLNIVVNGSIRLSQTFELGDIGAFRTLALSADINLAATDEVTVTINFDDSGGASTWDISPDNPSTFYNGSLIQKLS